MKIIWITKRIRIEKIAKTQIKKIRTKLFRIKNKNIKAPNSKLMRNN